MGLGSRQWTKTTTTLAWVTRRLPLPTRGNASWRPLPRRSGGFLVDVAKADLEHLYR